MKLNSLESFTEGYIACMLWCGVIDDEIMDDIPDVDMIDDETLKECKADCKDFYESFGPLLKKTGVFNHQLLGHDFYLTRSGHGTGFWDRDYGPVGDELTEMAVSYGSFSLYLGDDGYLHGMSG
jgi:hypothetical protein